MEDEIVILSENISCVNIKTEPIEYEPCKTQTDLFVNVECPSVEPPKIDIECPSVEPSKIDMRDNDDILIEIKKEQLSLKYFEAKKSYTGKNYTSSVTKDNIVKDEVRGYLITTSTLAGLYDKSVCPPSLNVIEAPGAKIDQLEKIAQTELISCEGQDYVHVLSVFGLNDFCQNVPLAVIKNKVLSYKKALKLINPNIQCNFIQLPLPPKLCFLPDNLFPNFCNRTAEILLFNHFLTTQNDTRDFLSLEKIGVQDPDCFSSEI